MNKFLKYIVFFPAVDRIVQKNEYVHTKSEPFCIYYLVLFDFYRKLYPKTAEYTFYSNAYGILPK